MSRHKPFDQREARPYLHNGAPEVAIDVHLRHKGSRDVSQVKVARLGRETGPAGSALALNGNDGRAVGARKVGQVDDVEPHACVSGEERVLSFDERHRERKEAASVGRDRHEGLGERAVGSDVPDCEETGLGRGAFDGGDQSRVVLAEDDVARGARRTVRRSRLVEPKRALCVWEDGQTSLSVSAEAAVKMGVEIRRAKRKFRRDGVYPTPFSLPPLRTQS
jgi:hypothetical protein